MHPTSYLEQYFEPFREWLSRDDIVELAINPNGEVWVEVAGDATMRPAGKRVEAKAAQNLAQSIVGDAKARVSEKNPLVSGKIDYAGRPLRVQIAVPPAIEQGASITIRLFAPKTAREFKPAFLFGEAVSLETLRREKMRKVADLSQANLDQALKSLIEDRLNILVSGGTSTGKTTFARNLMSHVDHGERLITIEDAFELFPDQPNTVSLLSERSPASQRSANALLQASLRMRPDRIIVGELRGSEALTYLEAINTGHGGSVSTIHAETAELAIDRLAIMVLQAGTPLTFAEVREYIRKSIDVIIQLGRSDGRRGITEFYLPVNE